MQVFAVLLLAAVALARPQTGFDNGAVTVTTERSFDYGAEARANTEADKYYSSGVSSYSNGASGVSSYSAAPAQQTQQYYSYQAAAPAVNYQANYQVAAVAAPAQQYAQQYYQAAAPAYAYQTATPVYQAAAPVQQYYQTAAPAYAQQYYQAAAPVYQAAAPVYQTAAPAVAFQAVTAAPAVAYQTVTAAPAITYRQQTASYKQTAAPAVSVSYKQTAAPAVSVSYQQAAAPAVSYKPTVSVRGEDYESNYQTNYDQTQYAGGETKVFKHVYAFAAPEEPAVRARINVQAPVSKNKHYKLVFIKAPSQQTIVDSDITLPAQDEEKTLIYLLSKERKQLQPEIRIKQAQSAKQAKPEVFFLKYKNEQEAQAIASGAISGQTSDVPANGEIISDGSVSILGQSQSSGQYVNSAASFGSGFNSDSAVYRTGASSGASNFASGVSSALPSNVASGFASGISSTFSSGLSSAAQQVNQAAGPATTYTSGSRNGFSFGTGVGSSAGLSAYSQDPASLALASVAQSAETYETSTAAAAL